MNIFGFSISRAHSASITPAKKKRAKKSEEPIISAAVGEVTKNFATPYVIGWGLIILMLVVIPAAVLLPLNVAESYKTVAAVTLFSTVVIWFFGVSPLANAYAGVAGGVWGILNDKLSVREGAEQGIRTLFRAITIASFVFAVEGMIAFFVSFGANPDAYLGLLVLGVVGALLGLVFKTPTKSGLWLVGGLMVFFAITTLFGVRFAIPAAEDMTAGQMASSASTAVSSAAAKATSTASTTKKPSTTVPATESVVFDIPAEGGIVTLKPGVVSVLKMPADTLGYMNFVVGASAEEVTNDSYLGYITEYRPGKDHSLIRWIPKPEAFVAAGKDEIQVMVNPTNEHTRLVKALTS